MLRKEPLKPVHLMSLIPFFCVFSKPFAAEAATAAAAALQAWLLM